MRLEAKALLFDVREAVELIETFVAGHTYADYAGNAFLRSAVERQFEIIGEALRRLSVLDPDSAGQIRDLPRIIAFRNVLAHRYDQVAHEAVWQIIQGQLPELREDVAALLS